MPELVTHTLAAAFIRRPARRHYPMLLLGAVLPDLIHRSGFILLSWILMPRLLSPDDIPPGWYLTPFNSLLGVAAVAYFISLLCEQSIRRDVFQWLLIGIAVHFFLDGLQQTLPGAEGYYWFFPFSWYSETVGLYWPEDSLYVIPLLLPMVLLWEWRMRRKKPVIR